MRLFIVCLAVAAIGCQREDPFQYPEPPEKLPPTWNYYAQRTVKPSENWTVDKTADGCNPTALIDNLAVHELNYTRGFASVLLVPDTTACKLGVTLNTNYADTEISTWPWDSLAFEFFFSEYEIFSGTALWFELRYKNLHTAFNISRSIDSLSPASTDPTLRISYAQGKPVYEIDGITFTPAWNEEGAFEEPNADQSDPHLTLTMTTELTEEQSFYTFQLARFTRYGTPD